MRRFTAIIMILFILIPCVTFADTGEKPTQDKPLVKTTTPIKIEGGKTGWVWIVLGLLAVGGGVAAISGGGGGGSSSGTTGNSGSTGSGTSSINFGW